MGAPPRVVLASQSPYRRELLGRLLPDFRTFAPDIDESRLPGEPPARLAGRLAHLKARAGADRYPGTVIIGSDQVAALGDETLGKPGSADRAVAQLLRCSGQRVEFHTAVCVIGPVPGADCQHVDLTQVQFRHFSEIEARRYVLLDQPVDCAGSFKAEQRGVVLLESITTVDPTAIQGLPLIKVAQALLAQGVALFG